MTLQDYVALPLQLTFFISNLVLFEQIWRIIALLQECALAQEI